MAYQRHEAQDRFVEADWSKFYDTGYGRGADILKILLMPFACFLMFGFPTRYGNYVSILSGFVPVVFYLLCGFFTIPMDENARLGKLKRGAKRSGLAFLILLIALFALNVLIIKMRGGSLFPAFTSKRLWFNWIVLSVWPFPQGGGIGFIQSLFYAYLILLILHKLKALRFFKIIFLAAGLAGLVLSEFSGLLNLNLFMYPFVPSNVFTFALPLMMLGALIREKFSFFMKIPPLVYWIMILGGVGVSFLEFTLLSRVGALRVTTESVGFLITAIGLAGWALVHPKIRAGFLSLHGRNYARRVYILSQPLYFVMMLLVSLLKPELQGFLLPFGGIVTFVLCFVLAFLIGFIKGQILFIKKMDAPPEVGQAPR